MRFAGPRRLLLPVLVLVTALFGANVASAAPATRVPGTGTPAFQIVGSITPLAAPTLYRGPQVRFFDTSRLTVRISAPRYYVVRGQFVGGQYEYPYDVVVQRGKVAATIELAMDGATHTQLIAVGVVAPDASAPVPGTSGTAASATTFATPADSHNTGPRPYTASTSGYFRTVWSAPLGREVNEVKDTINFTYDGTYVDSLNGSDYRWWYIFWGEKSHSIGSYYANYDTEGVVWTYDHFQNSGYCWPLGNTDIYYSDNNVYGFGAGDVGGHINTWVTGNCSFAFSYYTVVSGGA